MSVPREAPAAPLPRRRGLRAIATFFLFIIMGPPLGLLTITAVGAVFRPDRLSGLIQMATSDLGKFNKLAMATAMLSYVAGGVQAGGVGLVAALAQYLSRAQRIPLSIVLLASFVASLVLFVVFFWQPGPRQQQPAEFFIILLAFFVGPHLCAGLGCWLMATLFVRPQRQASLMIAP